MPPVGSVTITWHPATETITLDPILGRLNRNIQVMQWSLVVPDGSPAKFGPDGISFPSSSSHTWPGQNPPTRENDWQYRASVERMIPHGQPSQVYHYDIAIDTGGHIIHFSGPSAATANAVILVFDPDIENQPQP